MGNDFDAGKMVDNHGVHGTQDLANVLVQHGVPLRVRHLAPERSGRPAADWRIFAWPPRRRRGLRRLALGLLGYPFPGMGDFAVDTTHLAATLGCQWTVASGRGVHPAGGGRAARCRRAAQGRVPLAVRRGRRRDRRRPGRHRPGRAGAAGDRRRAAARRLQLPVHGLRRGRADRDAPLRGRQPPDGRRRRVCRRRRPDRRRGHAGC